MGRKYHEYFFIKREISFWYILFALLYLYSIIRTHIIDHIIQLIIACNGAWTHSLHFNEQKSNHSLFIPSKALINRSSLCLFTATMICGGLVMYPVGWDNREVRESCGKGANVYNLGEFPHTRTIKPLRAHIALYRGRSDARSTYGYFCIPTRASE